MVRLTPVRAGLLLAVLASAGLASWLGWWILRDPAGPRSPLPACAFRQLTGLLCTGCGGTRAAHHLAHGRPLAAAQANLLVAALPLLALLGLLAWLDQRRRGGDPWRWAATSCWILAGAVLAFTVLRNLPWPPFTWLAPPATALTAPPQAVESARLMKPRVLVLRAAGTNCDAETAHAFALVGAEPEVVHVNRLREAPALLREAQILAIPGGFSYGDDIASGRVFANELMSVLRDELTGFVARGGFAIGICNGFQVLVKSGLLPNLGGTLAPEATLTDNTSGLYQDRWVRCAGDPGRCRWIADSAEIELPVAHAEGRFAAADPVLDALERGGQVALRYAGGTCHNGSARAIAGVCDPSGRVFGLMPHPERFLRWENHPRWTREPRRPEGDGVRFFRTAVSHFR